MVNRTDQKDVQSKASQSAMQQKKDGKDGSQGISQKDEGNFNKKAEEDHPEAPKPVIGCVLPFQTTDHRLIGPC